MTAVGHDAMTANFSTRGRTELVANVIRAPGFGPVHVALMNAEYRRQEREQFIYIHVRTDVSSHYYDDRRATGTDSGVTGGLFSNLPHSRITKTKYVEREIE
mmetsp:Transcript_2251/g.3613  ORF Transcript_2251/g.3613 Transcript_2251/m.3613 type:complete len:102 (-) Transcript_2251:144-449(-)